MSGYHAVVRAGYRIEREDGAWLQGIADAMETCIGAATGAYIVDPDHPGFLREMRITGQGLEGWIAPSIEAHAALPRDLLLSMYGSGPFVTPWSERVHRLRARVPDGAWFLDRAEETMIATQSNDVLGVFGGSPNGGVMCTVALSRSIAPRTRWALQRVAVHLAAAFRLREARSTEVDAVLDQSGRVLDRAAPIPEDEVRRAVTEMSAAQRLAETDADGAIAVWRGLVSGRWTLLHATEERSRRVLLLRRNEVDGTAGNDPVTRRISSVIGLAARGHSNKLIAYELGLPMSTVASDLRIGLERLGLRDRRELVRLER